ncbi:MAG: PDZ domain-containing protein [Ruminococcaceae bacterium]|nr:PDZ domain-containing protein [Oscillospiraceae bacterium]
MNQSHWDDNNDQNQNDCTEYTSSHTNNSAIQESITRSRSQRWAKKIAVIAVMLVLALSACLVAHAMGVLTIDFLFQDNDSLPFDGNENLPGFETSDGERISDVVSDDGDECERGQVDTGLTLYDVSNRVTAWCNFKLARLGAYVVESKYSDELQYGDYLLSINGTPVASAADAQRICDACSVGETVTFEVIRAQVREQDGCQQMVETTVTVEVTLREYLTEGIYFDIR